MSQPEATGFIASTRLPCACQCWISFTALWVLPISVSVPVMK